MPLPPTAPRKPIHTRQVSYRGFAREDGYWDIEGEMLDTKPLVFSDGISTWEPNEPIHHMLIRVTIDGDLLVRDIAVAMDAFPHAPCPQVMGPMSRMVGCTMGRGWRKAIEQHLGGIQGCSHLRELLFNMATAAYQSIPPLPLVRDPDPDNPPRHFGQCLAWDFNGPVIEHSFPMFFRRDPKAIPHKES